MKKLFITTLIMIGMTFFVSKGVYAQTQETPKEGLMEIIKLYEKQDFDALVRTRYAELYKAKEEKQVLSLIERFTKRFSNKKKLEGAIGVYKSLLDKEPEFSEDGKMATYNLEHGFVKLSLTPDNKWGFHL